MSIKLSPKHGLNPTIPVCFFCGKQKNMIALLGRVGGKKDLEVPMTGVVLDYEPCDCCKESWDKGVALLGVTTTQPEDNRPPMKAQGGVKVYPTGDVVVVREEFAQECFNLDVTTGSVVFVEDEVIHQLMGGQE